MMGSRYGGVPDTIVKPTLTLQGAFNVQNQVAGTVPFDVQGAAGQTAVIARVRDSAGAVLFSIDNSGNLVIAGSATIAIDQAITGNLNLTGILTVSGVSTLNSSLSVTGAVAFSDRLTVDDLTFFGGYTTAPASYLRRRGAAPVVIGTSGALYSLAGDADTTELWYLDAAGNTVQITDAGGLDGASLFWDDDEYIRMGNLAASPDVRIGWNTAQTVDAWYFGTADAQNVLLVAENGDRAYDFAHGAQTNPTLFIQSAVQSATQWLSLAHNQTDGLLSVGTGIIRTNAIVGIEAALPTLQFYDTDGADADINANIVTNLTDVGSGTEDADVTFSQQIAGALTAFLTADADGNITLGATRPLVANGGGSLTGTWTDLGSVTTVDINGGTVDGATVGATSATTGRFTTVETPSIFTADNAASLILNIPVSGADAGAHTLSLQIDGNTGLSIAATGNGAGAVGVNTINIGVTGNADVIHIGDANALVDLTDAHWSITELGVLSIVSMGADWTNAGRTVADAGILTTVDINGGSVDGATIGAASASTIVGTTITANTGFAPDADDGAYLGVSGTAFSDLFLASGGVINWAAADVTLTHSAGTLALAGTAQSSGLPKILSITPPANTGITASTDNPQFLLNASTQTWATGAVASLSYAKIETETVAFAGASTVADATTLDITAPTAGGFATFTKASALRLNGVGAFAPLNIVMATGTAGNVPAIRIDANELGQAVGDNSSISWYTTTGGGFEVGRVGVTSLTGGYGLTIQTLVGTIIGIREIWVTDRWGNQTFTTQANAAQSNLTASTEFTGFNVNSSATKTWATGALTTQREVRFQAGTYAAAGASLFSNIIGVQFDTPITGANVTVTTLNALQVGSAATINQVAGTIYASIGVPAHTITLGNTTNITSVGFGALNLGQITVTQAGAANTLATAATLYIANAPVGAGSTTITAPYSIWVDDGVFRNDGILQQNDAIYFTQTDGNEKIDSAADGYLDLTVTTAHRFNMSAADTDVRLEFLGTTSSGLLEWMEDEDYFRFSDSIFMVRGIIGKQGTDIASGSTIVIPTDGNTFELTGTTAVNLITSTGYQDGFKITLIANESVTINHATATSGANITILLAGAGNFAMTANDTLTVVLCSTTAGGQAWREISRAVV